MDSAFHKLRRADDHLNALKGSFQRFLNSEPHRFVRGEVTENDRRYGIVTVQVLKPIPDDFGLIVGDICNNLRSALDHLLWHFHLTRNPAFNRNVYFPIFECETAFKRAGAKSIQGLSNDLKVVFEWAQPYKRGHNLLSILRQLNDTDKHRLIPILAATAEFHSVAISAEIFERRGDEPPATLIVPQNQRIEDGTELIRFPLPEAMPEGGVNVKTEINFNIVFGDMPQIAHGLEVGETLSAIRNEVQTILIQSNTLSA